MEAEQALRRDALALGAVGGGDKLAAGADVLAGLRACMRADLFLSDRAAHDDLVRQMKSHAGELAELGESYRKAVLAFAVRRCLKLIQLGGWLYALAAMYFTLPDYWPVLRKNRPPTLFDMLPKIHRDVRLCLEKERLNDLDLHDPANKERLLKISKHFPVRIQGKVAADPHVARKIVRELLIAFGTPKALVQRSWSKFLNEKSAPAVQPTSAPQPSAGDADAKR